MSTRVLLDDAGTADSSKSLQSEDSFINAFLKNASFSDASSSEDEGVLESYPTEKVDGYSKDDKDNGSASGVDSIDPTEYMYQYNSSSSEDGSDSKNSNTENSAFSNNQMDSSRFSETSSMNTGISTASDSQINSLAETSSVFVDEDGYSTQSETATENSSVFPMAEETNGNQQQRNNFNINSINNDGDDNNSEMDGDNETLKEGDLSVHNNGLKDGDESFMTDGNTTNNDNMTHRREDDSIYEGRSYKLSREAFNPILDEISDSQKDEISLESGREQPLCYTICGCGPSEYMPTNEIKVSKSKISRSLQHVQSDLSDSSGDMSEAKGRGHRDKAGESNYIKKLPSFHRMQKFIEQVSSKSFGAIDSSKEDEIDRNSTQKVKHNTEESNRSSSPNVEENMDKEESSRTLSENELGTSTRAMEELGIDRDFLNSISAADKGSNNTDLKRLQSEADINMSRNEDNHAENRCNILEYLEASFNDVTNCFSRMICHDEDEDLDLLIELEMREKLSVKSISDSIMSPIPKLLRDKVKLPGQKHRKERSKIEKRSDTQQLQSEEVFNESFGNDSLFDRSYFSVGNDGQILLSPKNRDEVIQRREETVIADDTEENPVSEIISLPDNTKSDQDLSKNEIQSSVLDLRDIIIQQEQNSIRNLDSSYMSDDDDDDDDCYGQNRSGHYNSHETANEKQYLLPSNACSIHDQVDMRDIAIEQEISINPSCMHDVNKSYISDGDDNEGDDSDQSENDYEEYTGHTGIHSTIHPVQLSAFSDSKKNFHDDSSYMSSSSDESSGSDSPQQYPFKRNLHTSKENHSNTIMLGSDNIHEKTTDLRDIIIQQETDFIIKNLGSSDLSDKIIDKVETERDLTRIHVDKASCISNVMTIEKSISTGINTTSARLNDDSSYMSSSSSSEEESFINDTSIEEKSLSQIQNVQIHDSFQSDIDLRDVIIKQEEENIKNTDSSYFSDEEDDDDDNEGDVQDRNHLLSQLDNETFLDVRDIIIEQESTMNPALVTDCNASYFSDDDEDEEFDDQFIDTSSSNVLKSFSYNEYGKENPPSWDVPLEDPENIDFVQNSSDQNIGDSYVKSSSSESIKTENEPLQNVLSLRSNANGNLSPENNQTSTESIERIKRKQTLMQIETKVGEVKQSVNLKPSDDHIHSATDTEHLTTISSSKKETGSQSVETAKNKGTAALVSAAQNLISKAQVKLTVQNDLAVLQQKVLEKQESAKEENTETEVSSLTTEKKNIFEVSTNDELTDTNVTPKVHISPDTSSINLDERRKRIAERRARLAKLRLAIEESANKGTCVNESREVDSDLRSTSLHEDRTQDSVSSADREDEMKPTKEIKSDDFSDQSEEQHSKVWLSRVNSNLNAKARRRELMKKKFQRQLQRAKATP